MHLDRWYCDTFVDSLCLSLSPFYSMRLLPYKQDTGGFFVAVLQSTESPEEVVASESVPESTSSTAEGEASSSSAPHVHEEEESFATTAPR